jgi:hypothetical protein
VRCGYHSEKGIRKNLPRNPRAKEIKEGKENSLRKRIAEVARGNNVQGREGHVIVSQLKMMKAPTYTDGYLPVLANFKDGGKFGGWPSLSPKSLGPIRHQMPGLPECKNLENFHQEAKVFAVEVDTTDSNQKQKPEWFERRKERYASDVPYRHKHDPKVLPKNNKNDCLYSLYYDLQGREVRLTYLECRYVYCKLYEKMVLEHLDFRHLKDLNERGTNLEIWGYDGYPVTQSLWDHYLDTSRPFGHELCLYTLLTEPDAAKYPWNQFRVQHPHLYNNLAIDF